MRSYTDYLAAKRGEYGSKFSAADLAPQFVPYFRTGQRIKVQRTYEDGETYTRTGRVGVTTGWRPAFLLMHRSSDHGSSDVLSADDKVIAVQHGRRYYPQVPE